MVPSLIDRCFGSWMLWVGLAMTLAAFVSGTCVYWQLEGTVSGAANIVLPAVTLPGSGIVIVVCIAYFAMILNQALWLARIKKS